MLADLNAGGCLSEFRWSGGGQYKGKPWAEHLPTDASVSDSRQRSIHTQISDTSTVCLTHAIVAKKQTAVAQCSRRSITSCAL